MNLHTERHLQVYEHNMCDMDSAEVFLIVDDLILKTGTVILINDTEISLRIVDRLSSADIIEIIRRALGSQPFYGKF